MSKRIQAVILSISVLVTSFSLRVNGNQTEFGLSVSNNKSDYSNILDASSVTSISTKTVNDILEQSKFRARQGHGFAAERGNTLIDKIKGKNTSVIGDSNIKNGADRIIRNPDKTVTYIQDKYYSDAKAGINACFDESGAFRYLDGDGNPMQIEVPRDQYDEAVNCMREKITEGKVTNITDPDEAKNLVRKGALSYKQAMNLAKAGTVESLAYDAAHGVVNSVYAFGISTVLNYTVCRLNGIDEKEALKIAADEGFKTCVLASLTFQVCNSNITVEP